MALAVKKRFNFLFEKNTLKFEKSLIATFFTPNIKLRVLDSLKIHVDGMDRNYLLNLITENNLNEISGFTFPTVIYNRGKVLESAQENSKISRCFVLWEP